MNKKQWQKIHVAKDAAIEILLNNSRGPYQSLPRTAGFGYPEPYTRDLMICGLGILTTGNRELLSSLRRVLQKLASNQSRLGHIPGLVHDGDDRGSSDTTPLFLLTLGIYRKFVGEPDFLEEARIKAMTWMEYQSPSDDVIVDQMPTSDWRDEQWVLGYGLYVNTLVYCYLKLYKEYERADLLEHEMDHFTIRGEVQNRHIHEGLVLPNKPYFAAWSYKVLCDERFDLLGNSLAMLSGLASPSRSRAMISWIERETLALRQQGELALELPPNYFPFIRPEDPDWHRRYYKYNLPGEYHNGGVWPFICGFYIAAIVATGRMRLAEHRLMALTELVQPAREARVNFGFNEWFRAQDGTPQGIDWQSWSAAMYLYAAECVQQRKTLFFDEIRSDDGS